MVDIELLHKVVYVLLFLVFFASTYVFVERILFFTFSAPYEKKEFKMKLEEGEDKDYLFASYISKLSRGKGFLMFSITSAPLLGLLGTVFGIMESFQTMAERGISDIAMVSKGVAFALRATALGIVVALFSLAYYYVLNALVKKHSILK